MKPASQTMPEQETGMRPVRPLPYELHAHGSVGRLPATFEITFGNSGAAAVVFHVRSTAASDPPRDFTVEPQKQLSDVWSADGAGEYDLSVHGPNGFLRAFKGIVGGVGRAILDVRATYDVKANTFIVSVANDGPQRSTVTLTDEYTGRRVWRALDPGQYLSKRWSLVRSFGWYDVVVTVNEDPAFECRLAGHLETGEPSVSDPMMGRLHIAAG